MRPQGRETTFLSVADPDPCCPLPSALCLCLCLCLCCRVCIQRFHPALGWMLEPSGQPDESSRGHNGVGDYLLEPTRYRQLFLDDYAIESWDGCTKSLHQPKLCGVCIGPHEGHSTPQSRSAPCYNPEAERWEWWYMGGMATSPDGEVWQVSGEPTAAIRSLIRDDNEPDPNKRYKALLDGYRDDNNGGNVSGLTPATSPTGLGDTWCAMRFAAYSFLLSVHGDRLTLVRAGRRLGRLFRPPTSPLSATIRRRSSSSRP